MKKEGRTEEKERERERKDSMATAAVSGWGGALEQETRVDCINPSEP